MRVNADHPLGRKARLEAEPQHLQALQEFAARAYRRPLTAGRARRTSLAYYRSLREHGRGLSHEEAMRDCVVSVLMSPDFCYRDRSSVAGTG